MTDDRGTPGRDVKDVCEEQPATSTAPSCKPESPFCQRSAANPSNPKAQTKIQCSARCSLSPSARGAFPARRWPRASTAPSAPRWQSAAPCTTREIRRPHDAALRASELREQQRNDQELVEAFEPREALTPRHIRPEHPDKRQQPEQYGQPPAGLCNLRRIMRDRASGSAQSATPTVRICVIEIDQGIAAATPTASQSARARRARGRK